MKHLDKLAAVFLTILSIKLALVDVRAFWITGALPNAWFAAVFIAGAIRGIIHLSKPDHAPKQPQ